MNLIFFSASQLIVLFFVVCAGSGLQAETYYIDNVAGNDLYHGLTQDRPWKSLSRANNFVFKPGDIIYLKRSQTWNETLVVSSSGSEKSPIIYSSYGVGNNPVIKTSVSYNDWRLAIDKNGVKIWEGKIDGYKNHWSAMKEGVRVPVYFGYKTKGDQKKYSAPKRLVDMEDGFFYSPLNCGVFYYRYDKGHPGELEIGVRRYGIYIKNKSFVTIDGIDTYGPGGQPEKGSATGSAHIVIESSDHITIKNSRQSYNHNNGIRVTMGSYHCTIENVISHGHRSTGIYLWEAGKGNKILNSEVYDCGTVISDTGDMGLIGVWKTEGSIIEGCYVHDNGHKYANGMDASISIVQSPRTKVLRNNINSAGGTGILIAENSDNSSVEYNVVNNWGVFGSAFRSNRHNAGIRIGGGYGNSTANNIKVHNNLISNGHGYQATHAAFQITKNVSRNLSILNNIIMDNSATDFSLESTASSDFSGLIMSNNVFYKSGLIRILYNNKNFEINEFNEKFKSDFNNSKHIPILKINPGISLDLLDILPRSKLINGAYPTSAQYDFYGRPIQVNTPQDIGPFEYQW